MSLLEEWLKDNKFRKDYVRASLVSDVQEEILRAMDEKGVSYNLLAMRLGKPIGYVKSFFAANNLSTNRIADVCEAVGVKIEMKVK